MAVFDTLAGRDVLPGRVPVRGSGSLGRLEGRHGAGRRSRPRSRCGWPAMPSRNQPSEGAVHDLWAKALALQDPAGQKAVLVTLDVCGIGRDLSLGDPRADRGAARPGARPGRPGLLAHALRAGGRHEPDHHVPARRRRSEARSTDYARFLARTGPGDGRRPGDRPASETVELAWETGRCDFAVNRRNNKEKRRPRAAREARPGRPRRSRRARAPRPRLDGKVRAVVFGYACHCTVLDFYKFCGDYAGFAQIDLESATSRVARRCSSPAAAADQNPLPRRTLELAEGYGRQLADAVGARAGQAPMRPIEGPLRLGLPGDRPGVRHAAHPRAGREGREVRATSPSPAAPGTCSEQIRGTRQACPGLSLPRPGLAARRPDLGLPRRRGHRRLLAADQAEPRRLAHLGLGLLQRRDGLHPLAPRPQGRRLRGGRPR